MLRQEYKFVKDLPNNCKSEIFKSALTYPSNKLAPKTQNSISKLIYGIDLFITLCCVNSDFNCILF